MKSNVSKAIEALGYLEEKHLEFAQNLKLKAAPWEEAAPRSLGIEIAETFEQLAKNLAAVKKILVGDCKHPKKMHDTYDGVLYCMNCNLDIPKS